MNQTRLSYYTACSLAVHVFFFYLLFGGHLRFLIPPKPLPPPPVRSLKITKFVPPPPAVQYPDHQFVPTDPSQKVSKPDLTTTLEAERDTALRSHERGTLDSNMPQLTGNPKTGITYTDSPASKQINSQFSPPSPQNPTPNQASSSSPPQPAPTPQESTPIPPTPLADPLVRKSDTEAYNANDLPILPPEVKSPQDSANPQSQTSPNQANSPPPAPPPSINSVHLDHSRIDGSHNMEEGDASPDARETEIGAYKAKLYRAIGSAWYIAVERNQSVLSIGEVKVRFYVRSNGTLDQLQVTEESNQSDILHNISVESIHKCEPFSIFSEKMIQQIGDGYWDEITFSIY